VNDSDTVSERGHQPDTPPQDPNFHVFDYEGETYWVDSGMGLVQATEPVSPEDEMPVVRIHSPRPILPIAYVQLS
jgi:hypothetical protein